MKCAGTEYEKEKEEEEEEDRGEERELLEHPQPTAPESPPVAP
jgi:hypothetical protein